MLCCPSCKFSFTTLCSRRRPRAALLGQRGRSRQVPPGEHLRPTTFWPSLGLWPQLTAWPSCSYCNGTRMWGYVQFAAGLLDCQQSTATGLCQGLYYTASNDRASNECSSGKDLRGSGTKRNDLEAKFLTCILQPLVRILLRISSILTEKCSGFSSLRPGKCRTVTPSGQSRFLPSPFLFIVSHLFAASGLYSFGTGSLDE
jgi:hypothetical protein